MKKFRKYVNRVNEVVTKAEVVAIEWTRQKALEAREWFENQDGMGQWLSIGLIMLAVIAAAAILWPIIKSILNSAGTHVQQQQDDMFNQITNS